MNNSPYTPEQLLEAVKTFIFNNYNRNQPWLSPAPIRPRKPSTSLIRMNRTGDGLRKPVLSDFFNGAKCAVLTGHDLSGLTPFMVDNTKLIGSKSGVGFHKEIDRLIKSPEFKQHLPGVNIATDWDDLVSVSFNGLGYPLRGKMDIYDLTTGTIIEIKSLKQDEEFPSYLPDRTMGQVASYLHGNIPSRRKYGTPEQSTAFVLYLPTDLSEFNPDNDYTFQVFRGEKKDTEITFKKLKQEYEKNIWLYNTYGLAAISSRYQCKKQCNTCHGFRKFREEWIVEMDTVRGRMPNQEDIHRMTIEYYEEMDEFAA